jgi:tetratricopeptide (TPR) repeat protein
MSLQQFFTPAISWLSKFLPVSSQADSYIIQGNGKFDLGDYKGAIADYNEAIRLNPNASSTYITYSLRGSVKYLLGDYEGAIADYNEAIRLNHNYANAYLNRGRSKFSLDDPKGAIADYNEAIRLNPNDLNTYITYIQRSLAKYQLGEYEGAIDDCNEAIHLNPDFYFTHQLSATIWDRRFTDSQQNHVDLEQAISAYERAVALSSEHQSKLREELTDAQYRLGLCYVQQGRWYDGLAKLRSSLDYYRQTDNLERRADVLAQIARVHLLFGDWDRARLFYRDALRLYCHIDNTPGIANCRLALGRMMLYLGYLEDAQRELETASTLYDDLNSPRKAEAEEVLQVVHHFQAKGEKIA